MIQNHESVMSYFENAFDLSRVSKLPITDKFRLINYIKLVGEISDVALSGGTRAIADSPLYTKDRTFHLLLSLAVSKISPEMISDIVEFYAYNFEDSDVYYTKLIVLGAGTLMIQNGVETRAILSYLISLLGNDFLKNNYQRIFDERKDLNFDEETIIEIDYKNFDYTYRKLKYDLLALLEMKRSYGHAKMRKTIFKYYDNEELKLYFSMLDVSDKEISEHLYRKMMADAPKMDRFLLTASRSIARDHEIIEMHYLLNAIIGKFTNFDKPYSEVIEEIKMREAEIRALIPGA